MTRLKAVLLVTVGGVCLAGCAAGNAPDAAGASDQITVKSTDLLDAADQMAHDLLTDPRLNQSQTAWTMAIGRFEDHSCQQSFDTNYDLFLQRLRTDLSEQALGQIVLIETKQTLTQIRDSNLNGPGPDYMMTGNAADLPSPGANCFLLQFTIFSLQTREQLWSHAYAVKITD